MYCWLRGHCELFVVSSGFSFRTIDAAMHLRDAGVKIFSIGVTNNIDKEELAALSSPPHLENENWFTAPNFDALSSIVKTLTEKTCGMSN